MARFNVYRVWEGHLSLETGCGSKRDAVSSARYSHKLDHAERTRVVVREEDAGEMVVGQQIAARTIILVLKGKQTED